METSNITITDQEAESDIIISLGGDGTILSLAGSEKAILGINIGHLGFMTAIEQTELERVSEIEKGAFELEERMMLNVKLVRNGETIHQYDVLNEAAVTRGEMTKLMHMNVIIDGKLAAYHSADGMIVSTPTGSTAYSMAAGGPIIEPTSSAVAITPISSHSLTLSRSLVVSPKSIITLELIGDEKTLLSLDGREMRTLNHGDRIVITKSEKTTKLMRLRERSFCDVLYKKLSK